MKISDKDLKSFLNVMAREGIGVMTDGRKDMLLAFPKNEDGTQMMCAINIDDIEVIKGNRKAMISQPTGGLTDAEIVETRDRAICALRKKGYKLVNTPFTDEWYSMEGMEDRGVVQVPLCFLAKSLENMSLCHAAYFCKGWEKARGCKIEHDAAVAYGLEIIYEE